MICPNCGKTPPEPYAADCPSCGIVFAKWKPRALEPGRAAPVEGLAPVDAATAAGKASVLSRLAWAAVAACAVGGGIYFRPSARAQRLFEEGARLKAQGFVEESRRALTAAVAIDPGGVGVRAGRFLRTKLPVHRVAEDAVDRNIQGFNSMAKCDLDGGAAIFMTLTQQYPDFEWPYGNLAIIYSHRGAQGQAEVSLRRALAINPCYVAGWLHLADVQIRRGDAAGRTSAIDSALQCDPEDWLARTMQADASINSDTYMDVHLCQQ
ncbi:MAG: hypothetical protein HY923_06475 [Elusimicrobia bacterium]|nr:hypothetical protein [Elusimicrobiota bacterium]